MENKKKRKQPEGPMAPFIRLKNESDFLQRQAELIRAMNVRNSDPLFLQKNCQDITDKFRRMIRIYLGREGLLPNVSDTITSVPVDEDYSMKICDTIDLGNTKKQKQRQDVGKKDPTKLLAWVDALNQRAADDLFLSKNCAKSPLSESFRILIRRYLGREGDLPRFEEEVSSTHPLLPEEDFAQEICDFVRKTELENETNKHILTHVKQRHRNQLFTDDAEKNPDFDQVVQSQFKIAKFIANHPQHALIRESLFEDLPPPADPRRSHFTKMVHMFFPQGIPSTLAELNLIQKILFYQHGAVEVLHALGAPNKVFKAISPQESKTIDAFMKKKLAAQKGIMDSTGTIAMTPGLRQFMVHRRDEAALQEAERAFGLGFKNVDVVFGQAHDLRPGVKKRGWIYQEQDFA
jgi:hypothetical protein